MRTLSGQNVDFSNVKQSDIQGVLKMLEQIQETVPTTKRIKTYVIIYQETQSYAQNYTQKTLSSGLSLICDKSATTQNLAFLSY